MQSFKNLEERPQASFGNLLAWKVGDKLEGRVPNHPDRFDTPRVEPDMRRLRQERDPSVTWIGHATYLVQLAGRSVLTDPVLSDRVVVVPRNAPPGVDISALPKPFAVTIS